MQQIDIIKRCLDNTAPIEKYEDLGVLFFARHFLEQCQSHKQAKIHYRMMKNALELFHPSLKNRMDRQRYVKIFREGAKSTHYSFVFPLYLINLVGGTMYVRFDNEGYYGADRHDYEILPITLKPEFILILSETHSSAERFTMNIKYELESNRDLKAVFGNKTPKAMNDETTGLWKRDSFLTKDEMIVFGVGAGQQIRGMLPFGSRPTFAVFDDIYSRKNTLTEETREKLRYWFFAEAINSVDSMKGKVLLVGTMVHEDTVFSDVAKSTQWKGVTYPVISEDELNYAISKCSYDADTRSFELPSKKEIISLQSELKTMAWPDRQNIEFILASYKEKYEMNKTSYYYQEYLHILSSPEDETYKDHQVVFTDYTLSEKYGNTWITFEYNSYKWKGIIHLNASVDLASSERDSADSTAILIGGWAHVYPQLDKFDMEAGQSQHPFKSKGLKIPLCIDGYLGKTDVYSDEITQKRGVVNLLQAFCSKYAIGSVIVEVNGQQSFIYREVKKALRESHPRVVVKEELNTVNKEEAINSVLQPIFQSCKIFLFSKIPMMYTVWSQLKHLGVAKHDDGADSLKILFKHSKPVSTAYDPQQVNPVRMVESIGIEKYVTDWRVY